MRIVRERKPGEKYKSDRLVEAKLLTPGEQKRRQDRRQKVKMVVIWLLLVGFPEMNWYEDEVLKFHLPGWGKKLFGGSK